MRKIITENEAIMLKNYMEEGEIKARFKIVPMSVLKNTIERGVKQGLSITAISESIGLAYISVYKLYEKMYKKGKEIQKDPRKLNVTRTMLIDSIKAMKTKSKIELAHILANKIKKPVSYTAINRILREHEVNL